MANNLFADVPAACVAKQTIDFAAAGFDVDNTRIIYEVGSPLKSWVPGRAINAVIGFTANKGYYIVPKLDMDKTSYLAPPLPTGGLTQLATPTLTATVAGSTQINLSWTNVANESSYKLEWSPNGTSGWTQIGGTIAANTTTYNHTGLTASTHYYYRVSAIGDGVTYSDSNLGTDDDITSAGSTTSYANTGGSGDRSALITVTDSGTGPLINAGNVQILVDGNLANTDTWFNPIDISGPSWIRFDFGSGASKTINEAKWYQSGTETHGTWKWQGSNDASTWTDIGSSFTLGGSTIQTITELSGNLTGYRFYQLTGISGTASSSPFLQEVEFKISA
jgi:hypothetical protein